MGPLTGPSPIQSPPRDTLGELGCFEIGRIAIEVDALWSGIPMGFVSPACHLAGLLKGGVLYDLLKTGVRTFAASSIANVYAIH